MANDRINYVKFVSPRVTAVYPHLNKADDKFGDPVFKVNGRASADALAPMVSAIEEMLGKLAKADPVMMALLPEKDREKFAAAVKAKKAKPADPAFIQETDEEGNELGTTVLKFKKNGAFKDKKTGAKVMTKLPLFDSKRNAVTAPIWGGSIVVVAGHYMPWVSAKNEYGVKLAMDAVQVIELKSGGSGGTADSYGFGEEEDGWAQPAETASETGTLAADVDSAEDF